MMTGVLATVATVTFLAWPPPLPPVQTVASRQGPGAAWTGALILLEAVSL